MAPRFALAAATFLAAACSKRTDIDSALSNGGPAGEARAEAPATTDSDGGCVDPSIPLADVQCAPFVEPRPEHGAGRALALVDPTDAESSKAGLTIRTKCLSRMIEGNDPPAKWCDCEPPFEGPRIGLGSGVLLSQEWALTSNHGLLAAARSRIPSMVRSMVDTNIDTAHCDEQETWTLPEASLLEIDEVHCNPELDLALVHIRGRGRAGDWEIGIASDTVARLRETKGHHEVDVISSGFPLGVLQSSLDGVVSNEPDPRGGNRSTVDDLHGSSGSMVLEKETMKLIGLIEGSVIPATRPGTGTGSCYRIPHGDCKLSNARVRLVDAKTLQALRDCADEGCQLHTADSWSTEKSCR